MKFRWHNAKKCWYGYADEDTVKNALNSEKPEADEILQEFSGKNKEGYLGATAWEGSKSKKHLYGAELSAAIRNDLKRIGLKNCSVSVKTYSGGQSITATLKAFENDFIPCEQFVKDYKISSGDRWIYTEKNKSGIFYEDFYSMTAEEQEQTRKEAAAYEWKRYTECEQTLNLYQLDKLEIHTPEFIHKIKLVKRVIDSYRYDDSNAMVDYFDTNFYYNIAVKPYNAR